MNHRAADDPMEHHENMWASVTEAVAVLYPTKGNTVSGTLHFTALPNDGGVHIHGTLTGLEPNSTHAFHIHEFGDSSSPDGMSAGGHYNPEHHKHGGPGSPEHHAGDLGNLTADATGTATIDIIAPGLSIAGLKDPIIGRSVVIHAKPDDLVSQPVGNAGARIAVGTIGIAKPQP
jgi:Cu-Zn family superoxide dismutase